MISNWKQKQKRLMPGTVLSAQRIDRAPSTMCRHCLMCVLDHCSSHRHRHRRTHIPAICTRRIYLSGDLLSQAKARAHTSYIDEFVIWVFVCVCLTCFCSHFKQYDMQISPRSKDLHHTKCIDIDMDCWWTQHAAGKKWHHINSAIALCHTFIVLQIPGIHYFVEFTIATISANINISEKSVWCIEMWQLCGSRL